MFTEYQLNDWLEIINYWDWKRLKNPHIYIVLSDHLAPLWRKHTHCQCGLCHLQVIPVRNSCLSLSRNLAPCAIPELVSIPPGHTERVSSRGAQTWLYSEVPWTLLGSYVVPDGISRNSDSSGLFRNQLFEWSLHVAGPGSHVSDTCLGLESCFHHLPAAVPWVSCLASLFFISKAVTRIVSVS